MRALLVVFLLASSAGAEGFDPDCASWYGSTKPVPLEKCRPIPAAALEYARQCLAMFPEKVDSKYVIIGNYHGVRGDLVRLYVLEWNKRDPWRSTIVLRGGLGQGAGNGSADGRRVGPTTSAADGWDSASSPGGCMRVFGDGGGNQMPHYPDIQAYKVEGLEQRNACVYTRGIHFHESDRVYTRRTEAADTSGTVAAPFTDVALDRNLANGASPGCFNLSVADYDYIKRMGYVTRKGTLFLSWDGCRDQIEPRGAPRRCKDAADVMDCRDRAPAPANLTQMMIEQAPKNKLELKSFDQFYDKLGFKKGDFDSR
jgi:hypothetical protein